MAFLNLFPQTAKLFRMIETIDEYKTPKSEWQEITEFRCRTSKNGRFGNTQKEIETTSDVSYILYCEPFRDIQLGDLIEIEGEKYRAGKPYIPYGANSKHHIEVVISFEREA